MDRSSDKLRWNQFSLKTLMLAVVVCALPLSWFAVRAERTKKEREATAEIDRLGGKVCYDYQCDESNTQLGGAIAPGPAWLRKLRGDDFLASVVCVHVKGGQVTDDVLKRLTDQLANVELLDIERAGVTDAGLAHLDRLSELKCLDLDHTRLSDAGLANLKGLTQLRRLNLCNTNITDAGLVHLEGLTNLKRLSLEGCKVSDEGVRKLQEALPNMDIEH